MIVGMKYISHQNKFVLGEGNKMALIFERLATV